MSAIVLRIKFPDQYPLIYKTLRVDSSFTAKKAIQFIAETVNVTSLLVGTEGLYIPDENRWLDDDTVLSDCSDLQEAEHIEFRDRNAPIAQKKEAKNDSSCCTIV